MWAQQLVAPRRLQPVDIPMPAVGHLVPGQVLVRMLAGGICGSDLPHFRGLFTTAGPLASEAAATRPAGFPMHEICGEVSASKDPAFAAGQYVVGWAPRSDAMAAYVVTDAEQIAACSRDLPPSSAVILQPLACVLYAMKHVPAVSGRHIAVIGQGSIGLLFSHVAKAMGARRVTGVDPVDRSAVASGFGVDDMTPAASGVWAGGLDTADRPDVVIEAVGHQAATLHDAVNAVRAEGFVYYFGVPEDVAYPFPLSTFFRKNARFAGGFTADKDRRPSLQRADEYLAKHEELKDIYITDRFGFKDAQTAFDLAVRPSKGRLKIIFETES